MANEATKKDLADLEKKINTKIQAVIDSANKAFTAETAALGKTIEAINKTIETYNKGFADLTKEVNDLKAVVNQHAKVINER